MPQQIVATALRANSRSIAYTYTEPTVFFEFAYDTARLAHGIGVRNVYVANGYMTAEMLELFQPYLDAANVDLKAFRDRTYQRYVGARLQPVLDNLKRIKALGIWLEVTTLVIPGINDDPVELQDVAQFISQELGADTPWHISRFYPAYEMTSVPITPADTLRCAWEIGTREGLNYVYLGNVADNGYQNTACPSCRRVLIRRSGFAVLSNLVQDGRCPECGTSIPGVGMSN
jgi:pyruvate formate lyase activating enzyme